MTSRVTRSPGRHGPHGRSGQSVSLLQAIGLASLRAERVAAWPGPALVLACLGLAEGPGPPVPPPSFDLHAHSALAMSTTPTIFM